MPIIFYRRQRNVSVYSENKILNFCAFSLDNDVKKRWLVVNN